MASIEDSTLASAMAVDDAPASTSKDSKVVRAAADDLLDGNGNSFSGRTTTINRDRAELFAYWRDFRNLPAFMENVERIDVGGPGKLHWVIRTSGNKTTQWDAIITDEVEGEYICWASADGARVDSSGRVDFRDAGTGRGTAVTLTLAYDMPGGAIGKLVATLLQREPALQARRDLRRFKQLMETGEIAVSAWTNAQVGADA